MDRPQFAHELSVLIEDFSAGRALRFGGTLASRTSRLLRFLVQPPALGQRAPNEVRADRPAGACAALRKPTQGQRLSPSLSPDLQRLGASRSSSYLRIAGRRTEDIARVEAEESGRPIVDEWDLKGRSEIIRSQERAWRATHSASTVVPAVDQPAQDRMGHGHANIQL